MDDDVIRIASDLTRLSQPDAWRSTDTQFVDPVVLQEMETPLFL